MANFSMFFLFLKDLNSVNYYALQLLLVALGGEYEALVQNSFSLAQEGPDGGIAWFWLDRYGLQSGHGGEGNKNLITKLVQRYRNSIVQLTLLGVVAHPIAFYIVQPRIARYPDLFEVGCNAASLVFFGLMFLYVQTLMYDEVGKYFEGVSKKQDGKPSK